MTTKFTVPVPGVVELSTTRLTDDFDTVVATTFVSTRPDGLVKLTITTKTDAGIGATASIALTSEHIELLANALKNARA